MSNAAVLSILHFTTSAPAERFAVRLLASLWLSDLQLSGLTPVQPAASLDSLYF